jgi:Acetyltransferase (isoleucine patch superfamily)
MLQRLVKKINNQLKVIDLEGIIGVGIVCRRIYNKFRSKVLFGRGVYIDFTTVVRGRKHITFNGRLLVGKYCRIEAISENNGVKYNPNLVFGKNVRMNDFVHIGCTNFVSLGDDCLLASKIYITDHNHGIYIGTNQSNAMEPVVHRVVNNDRSVIIGKNVWIGENVTVLPGVIIGNNSIIGANAVVTKTIPENSIAVGNPAQVVKQFNLDTKIWDSCNDL